MRAVKDSPKRINTGYIELYQVYAWDPATPLEETLRALDDLVDEGFVHNIGASDFRCGRWRSPLSLLR